MPKKSVSLSKIFQLYNFAIFLLAVLTFGVFLYLSIFISSQVITKSIEDSNNLIHAKIEAALSQTASIAQYLAYSDGLQKYLTCGDEYELISHWQQLQDITMPFTRTNPDLCSIIIYRASHRTPFFSDYQFPDNAPFYSIAPTFEDQASSPEGFSVIYSRYANLPSYAVYSCPALYTLNNERFGEFLGSIVIVLQPGILEDTIHLVSPKGIISSISVTDKSGAVIASAQLSDGKSQNDFLSLSTARTTPISGTDWFVTCHSNGNWIARQYMNIFLVFFLFVFLIMFILYLYYYSLRRYFKQPVISLRNEIQSLTFCKNERLPAYHTREINEIAQTINSLLSEYYQASERRRQLELANYEVQISKKISELQFLISQISPHFLLNTLSCIGGIATLYQSDEILDIVSDLSEMFRYSLYESDMVTLRDEYHNIQKYFDIIRIRFQNSYLLETAIPEELFDCPMPKMILQPLVENSLYHGLEPKCSGRILLSARTAEKILYLTISDNGVGMSPDQTASMQNLLSNSAKLEYSTLLEKKIGNVNICRRIKLMYGEAYGMNVESAPDKGTTVNVYFPVSAISAD